MNYFRSELYGASRTKPLYVVAATWLIGFVLVTKIFLNMTIASDPRESYFTGMIIVGTISGFVLAVLISNLLTGKKLMVLKQSISFGISKNTIYMVKFGLSLAIFILLTGVLVSVGTIFGHLYLSGSNQSQGIRLINSYPLLISSLALCHWLNFSNINPILSTILVLWTYLMSADFIQLLDRAVFKQDVLKNYMPPALVLKAVNTTHFDPPVFFIGSGLTLVFLLIGLRSFNRRDVA